MQKIINTMVLLTTLWLAWACSNGEQADLPAGNVKFVIDQTTGTGDKAGTRAKPAELDSPSPEAFRLTIRRSGNANATPVYDGNFVESMVLPVGTYDITASWGEDVPIGRDTPYYTGTTQTAIKQDMTTSAKITCGVANALISAQFGRDAEEKARFDKVYADYGIRVKVGVYSMDITPDQEKTSIYFPAGSSPELSFYGCLRNDNNRQVSFDLASESLPATFGKAEHAVVTLFFKASTVSVSITYDDEFKDGGSSSTTIDGGTGEEVANE